MHCSPTADRRKGVAMGGGELQCVPSPSAAKPLASQRGDFVPVLTEWLMIA